MVHSLHLHWTLNVDLVAAAEADRVCALLCTARLIEWVEPVVAFDWTALIYIIHTVQLINMGPNCHIESLHTFLAATSRVCVCCVPVLWVQFVCETMRLSKQISTRMIRRDNKCDFISTAPMVVNAHQLLAMCTYGRRVLVVQMETH